MNPQNEIKGWVHFKLNSSSCWFSFYRSSNCQLWLNSGWSEFVIFSSVCQFCTFSVEVVTLSSSFSDRWWNVVSAADVHFAVSHPFLRHPLLSLSPTPSVWPINRSQSHSLSFSSALLFQLISHRLLLLLDLCVFASERAGICVFLSGKWHFKRFNKWQSRRQPLRHQTKSVTLNFGLAFNSQLPPPPFTRLNVCSHCYALCNGHVGATWPDVAWFQCPPPWLMAAYLSNDIHPSLPHAWLDMGWVLFDDLLLQQWLTTLSCWIIYCGSYYLNSCRLFFVVDIMNVSKGIIVMEDLKLFCNR